MDAEIFLGNYCNELLGESFNNKPKQKISKNIKKNSENEDLKANKTSAEVLNTEKSPIKFTDDGFKVCTEIPVDDSDVSDAFESDSEEDFEENTLNDKQLPKKRQTEDGFKITNYIPPDDSDVSDAFDSDIDETNWTSVDKIPRLKECNSNSTTNCLDNDKKLLNPRLKNAKKPLLDLIKDFGMEDKFIHVKASSKIDTQENHKKRRILSDNELRIKDCSKKRGKKKKASLKPVEKAKVEKPSKKEADEAMRKARYDIFKFGSLGDSVDPAKTTISKEERRKAKIDLVVKLGAKPPKPTAVNYKKLIEIRKGKKEKDKEKREEEREMGLPVKKNEPKPRHSKDIDINPRIGKFRGGVLKISKRDLENMNAS